MSTFARGFRLHLRDGRALDGAVFPSGHATVLDDPELGISSAAPTLIYLVKGGYFGALVEWAEVPGALVKP